MKPEIIADIVQKVSENLKQKLKEAGIDGQEGLKTTVLSLIQDQLGVELKELQPTIAKAVLQQIPKGAMYQADRGESYDPAIGLASLPKARLEELKAAMLFSIMTPMARKGINAEMQGMGKQPMFKDTIQQDLSIQVGSGGGFLVPTEFHAEVLRRLTKVSTFRSQARWFSGVGMKGTMPRETGTVSITYEGEAKTIPTTEFALGDLSYSLSKRTALTRITRELYLFSPIDVLTLLATMFSEQDNVKDDDVFMNGNGKGMPMGLRMERSGINTTAQSGVQLDWTDLIALKHKLKIQYRNDGGIWIMSNNTIAKVSMLKDDQNRPIFLDRGPMGIGGPNVPPMTVGFILGYPVMEDNFIPENLGSGTNETEIWFSNLKRGYAGFDAGIAETASSDQEGTSFETNKMAVRMLRWDDAKPAIPEANCVMTGVK